MIKQRDQIKSDNQTDLFVIVTGGALARFLVMICQDYVLWTLIDQMKKMVSLWKKQKEDDIPQRLLQMETMQMI